MEQFPWDAILNIVFFAVGFILGLVQLWQAQKYYLADQQSKVNQINDAITRIAQRLAVIEGVTNRLIDIDRAISILGATSDSFQNRLFGIVEQQFIKEEKAGQVTAEATNQIKSLISQAFSEEISVDKINNLEEKLDRIVGDSNAQILNVSQEYFDNENLVEQVININDIELFEESESAKFQGELIKLPTYEYLILSILLESANQVVSVTTLAERVYTDTPVSKSQKKVLVHTSVYRLRRKFNFIRAEENGYIINVNYKNAKEEDMVDTSK